eukprot:ctg_668.g312
MTPHTAAPAAVRDIPAPIAAPGRETARPATAGRHTRWWTDRESAAAGRSIRRRTTRASPLNGHHALVSFDIPLKVDPAAGTLAGRGAPSPALPQLPTPAHTPTGRPADTLAAPARSVAALATAPGDTETAPADPVPHRPRMSPLHGLLPPRQPRPAVADTLAGSTGSDARGSPPPPTTALQSRRPLACCRGILA